MNSIEQRLQSLEDNQARLAEQLQLEADRYAIGEQITRYCRAVDRLDLPLLKSVFHADAVNHSYDGVKNGHVWADEIIEILRELFSRTMHYVVQKSIDVAGARAASETYFIAHHTYPAPGGLEDVIRFAGREYAAQCETEGRLQGGHEYICGGRYLHKWEKRDGVWKLTERALTLEWNHFRPTTHGDPTSIMSAKPSDERRDRDDPVYALFAELAANAG